MWVVLYLLGVQVEVTADYDCTILILLSEFYYLHQGVIHNFLISTMVLYSFGRIEVYRVLMLGL